MLTFKKIVQNNIKYVLILITYLMNAEIFKFKN